MTQHPPLRLIVPMPLRDDWPSAAELIRRLGKAISSDACTMEILLIDDCSVQDAIVAASRVASLLCEPYELCRRSESFMFDFYLLYR